MLSNQNSSNKNWLVVLTILKNMKVNGKDYPTYYGKLKPCSKPPTRKSVYWMFYQLPSGKLTVRP